MKADGRFEGYWFYWCEITVPKDDRYQYGRNLTIGCLCRSLETAIGMVREKYPTAIAHVVRKGERWQSDLLVEAEE